MLDNRSLVQHVMTLRGIGATDKERLCSNPDSVAAIANAIFESKSTDWIDRAIGECLSPTQVSGAATEPGD